MDGFRERLSGRYDRSGMRGSGYERMPGEDRYENDRYERAPRRGETVSQEAINEAVNEAITKANREQLDVIADFFDEAKADRMESERAIIDALSHNISEAAAASKQEAPVPAPAPVEKQNVAPIAVVDEQNAETLARIERIAGQNAEALNESSEVLERNVASLRSNAELLGEIRGKVEEIAEISRRTPAPAPMQDLTVDFSSEKDEIIGAVGDNRAILNMIRQDVLNGFARNAESEEGEEKIVPLSAEDAGNYYKELEEHVHKECVKCYRNVQSALTEQGAEANKEVLKSVSGMRIMVLLALIFSILGFASATLCALINLGIIVL